MQQITVIVRDRGLPRVHQGHSNDEAQQAYVDGLGDVPNDTMVLFHHIDLYSDIGDTLRSYTWRKWTHEGWRKD